MFDIDKDSINRISNCINRNFFVEAGAGSGKTTALVDRMVSMVEGGLDISRISAITFTKAAAGEFYARFQKKLSESRTDRARKALENIDLCFMGTIDSFCHMVLSEHPSSAGIPSDAAITDDSAMGAAYRHEFSRILAGEYGEALKDRAIRFQKFSARPQDDFVSLMKEYSSLRKARLIYPETKTESPDIYFAEKKDRLVRMLRLLDSHPEYVYTDNANSKNAYNFVALCLAALTGSIEGKMNRLVMEINHLEKLRLIPEAASFITESCSDFEYFFSPHFTKSKLKWYEICEENDPLMLKSMREYIISENIGFIDACLNQVVSRLRKQGIMTHSEYLLCLRDVIKKDIENGAALTRHIYERHSYFLIDEFQDTSPVQAEVFFMLTATEPCTDWKKCIPKPGSLFIVGDPKQSIYRFRNADVASFLEVKRLFGNDDVGEVLELTRNYRSTKKMCEWFNDVFSSLLVANNNGQCGFSQIPIGDAAEDVSGSIDGVYRYDIFAGKDSNSRSASEKQADAMSVSDIILGIVSDPGASISVRSGDRYILKHPEFSDFMVIVPSKTNLALYMRYMMGRKIPFTVEGKVDFSDCAALRAVSAIMSAVAYPYDRGRAFLARYVSGCNADRDRIDLYRKKAQNMTPSAVFSMIMDAERIFEISGTENAENLYFALELVRSCETESVYTLQAAADFIEELLYGHSGYERRPHLKRDGNSVHIANLHKVKGLEAPVVILADPSKDGASVTSRHVDYSGPEPVCHVYRVGGKKGISIDNYSEQQTAESTALNNEKDRLCYVAATRAKNALFVSSRLKSDGGISTDNIWSRLVPYAQMAASGTVLDEYESGAAETDTADGCACYTAAAKRCVLNGRDSETATYEIRRPSNISVKSVISADAEYDESSERHRRLRDQNIKPMLLGTMIHRMLEMIVTSGNRIDGMEMTAEIIAEYVPGESRYSDILMRVYNGLESGGFPQNNDVPQDIVGELISADEVFCELPFCWRESENAFWNGIMDVVYRKGGRWYIVDYKTNVDADDLDEHYRGQLEAYVSAFKKMTGNDATAMIYHIDT